MSNTADPGFLQRSLERLKPAFTLKRRGRIRTGLRLTRARLRYQLPAVYANRRRRRSPAMFVGITGSSGKSTAVSLLMHILAGEHRVHGPIIYNALASVIATLRNIPADCEFYVAEVGIGDFNQMNFLARTLEPDMAIITMAGIEHFSSFRNAHTVAREKGKLLDALREGGLALLNGDDQHVMELVNRTDRRVVTFGRGETVDYRAKDVRSAFPEPLSLTVRWSGGVIPVKTQFNGDQFWLSTIVAFAAAVELGVPAETAAARIATYRPMINRCGVIKAPGGPTFLVDTIKAPFYSVDRSFQVVAAASAPRKRIVLGQMSDFSDSRSRYRRAYKLARTACDEVIFVGEHAHRARATKEEVEQGLFFQFPDTQSASAHIKATAVPGELILLKSSTRTHLERIALDWIADVQCWGQTCQKANSCFECGTYDTPYGPHKRRLASHPYRQLRSPTAPWNSNQD